ncbi:hypothetical protein [Methylobacterium sp. Leaf85]|uniref:hypothetical protein n=1 Tax=Methylobacterium sp. Leaf85 TaxID=1736241 RepID=UPI0006F4339F|nr:hypothetical protein [Methylobacterium sp. Leaf85]KQO43636.1 hypothetical protein ASF08_09825 [Methylobacterium sp. Leaf85]
MLSAKFYTARPDFSGLDTLSVDVTFSNGRTLPYTFRITVPEGERRQAPAVSQAPAPRDGGRGSGRPAETARLAPTGRAATTEDFLRDTVREAAPANRRAPAAEPPKAMVRTEQPASAPDDVPPPRVEPRPRRARWPPHARPAFGFGAKDPAALQLGEIAGRVTVLRSPRIPPRTALPELGATSPAPSRRRPTARRYSNEAGLREPVTG